MFPKIYFGNHYFGARYFSQFEGQLPVGNIEYPWSPGYLYDAPIGTGLPLVCTVLYEPVLTSTPGSVAFPWTPGYVMTP